MSRRSLVLSIRPEWLDKLRSGEKMFELRRVFTRQQTGIVYAYESAPVSRISCILHLISVTYTTIPDIWDCCGDCIGMSRQAMEQYFHGRDSGWMLGVDGVCTPEDLPTLADLGLSRPPQNFAFVKNEWYDLQAAGLRDEYVRINRN